MSKRSNTPSREQIVDANIEFILRLPNVHGDISIASSICWACGIDCDGTPTRAHIVAHCHGGSTDPTNFYLLCDHCHLEQPDGADRKEQDLWILNAPSWNEWGDCLVADLLESVKKFAEIHSIPPIVLDGFYFYERQNIIRLIHEGYSRAAGLLNGRGNVKSNICMALLNYWEQ
jgi:hypothetical protein